MTEHESPRPIDSPLRYTEPPSDVFVEPELATLDSEELQSVAGLQVRCWQSTCRIASGLNRGEWICCDA